MSSNLVRLTTQDVAKGIPITDTLIVSEAFQVTNLSVVKLIDKYKKDFEEFGKLMSFQMTRETQRSIKCYEINEMQFALLVSYMKNTEIARNYKKKFVKAFALMKQELQARQETRHIGILVRKSLTDSIKNNVDEGNFKNYAYSNYSKLILKKVLGKDVKKLKQERRVPDGKNIRDYLTMEELEKVQHAESKVAMYIEMRKNIADDKQIYEEIKEIL